MRDVLRISVPLTVWLASFSAIYGLHGVICSGGWPSVAMLGIPLSRVVLVLAWMSATGLQIALLLAVRSAQFGSASTFVRRTSIILSVAALIATLWTLFPVVVTSTCFSR